MTIGSVRPVIFIKWYNEIVISLLSEANYFHASAAVYQMHQGICWSYIS